MFKSRYYWIGLFSTALLSGIIWAFGNTWRPLVTGLVIGTGYAIGYLLGAISETKGLHE